MKTQSLESREGCVIKTSRGLPIFDSCLKKYEKIKGTEPLLTDSQLEYPAASPLATISFKDMVGPGGCPLLTKS